MSDSQCFDHGRYWSSTKGESEHQCSWISERKPGDPIHQHADKTWWWYDETWTDEYGPFATREEAEANCGAYAREVLGI